MRLYWREDLSDHAVITAWPGGGRVQRGRPCTPAAFKRLPGEAIDDLRRSFRNVELMLRVPDPGPVVPEPALSTAPPA
eukprot:1396431-Lingulodinium_polyedra.AAC.1